ncbi:hypothetical protein PIB30_077003 [Stylosanthes scabra]|uniref:Uncharacterized protein n=1 Tax=Stylosanthes scabra TaxID=79078 RepID=A0ABU6YPD0_9FABA|nr:hypothetical protein [Stylosanthes scabra]
MQLADGDTTASHQITLKVREGEPHPQTREQLLIHPQEVGSVLARPEKDTIGRPSGLQHIVDARASLELKKINKRLEEKELEKKGSRSRQESWKKLRIN